MLLWKNNLVWCLLMISSMCIQVDAQSFVFGEHTLARGEKKSIALSVKSPAGDSTFIPITIIHGKEKGPVLGLIAGIHGYEYPPIMAMQKFPQLISADQIRGTLIIVHIANVCAFLGRSVYYNPVDGKNLNRTFPGNDQGTLTECLAHTLTHEVMARCDYLVDIHAGDANEDLHPYVAYYRHGAQAAQAKQMAEALGFDWISISDSQPVAGTLTKYCTAESVSRNIPTVAIEYGKLGQVSTAEAQYINERLINMLKALHMIPGNPDKPQPPIEITNRLSITSNHTGIFYSPFHCGDLIKKGTQLAVITDVWGNILTTLTAPDDGFIVYMMATPPVNKGEMLFSFAPLQLASW